MIDSTRLGVEYEDGERRAKQAVPVRAADPGLRSIRSGAAGRATAWSRARPRGGGRHRADRVPSCKTCHTVAICLTVASPACPTCTTCHAGRRPPRLATYAGPKAPPPRDGTPRAAILAPADRKEREVALRLPSLGRRGGEIISHTSPPSATTSSRPSERSNTAPASNTTTPTPSTASAPGSPPNSSPSPPAQGTTTTSTNPAAPSIDLSR